MFKNKPYSPDKTKLHRLIVKSIWRIEHQILPPGWHPLLPSLCWLNKMDSDSTVSTRVDMKDSAS